MAFEIITQLVYLLASLAVLATSAKYVVESASKLARFFGISEMAIGFLLLSMLTSLPELSVAILSSVSGNNNLSLGDLMGSNVTNIALVIGIAATVAKGKRFDIKSVNTSLIFLLLSVVPLFFILDGLLTGVDSIMLIALYLFFVYRVLTHKVPEQTENHISRKEAAFNFLTLLAGIGVVLISAGFVVENAVSIAKSLGIFQSFLGATIIALSTSMPELAVDITAARRGKWGLAIGDIFGSNVTNLTLLLGINVGLRPFEPNLIMAYPIAIFILLSSAFIGYLIWRSKGIKKSDGPMMLMIYAAYILLLSSTQITAVVG